MRLETPISKTQMVAEMVLAELARADRALTSGDLHARLEIDLRDTVIYRALTSLLKDGRIEIDEPRMNRRGQPVKTYRLSRSDAIRIMTHLEAELGQAERQAAHFAARVLANEDPADPEACLDSASASHNGDEMHVIHAHIPCETAKAFADLAVTHTDSVIRALAQMDIREPWLHEGQMHVDRLRALATHLDEGRPVLPQIDIVAWLFDLAAEIEEMTA